MRRDRWRWLALAAAIAVVGAACGGDGDGGGGGGDGALSGTTITFSIALADTERPAVQEVLGMFQDQTGARVNLTSITAQDLPQKLQVDVGAGRPTVHLFAQDNLALATLVENDLVQDLSDVQLPEGLNEATIPQEFDGVQYFLPGRVNVRVTYANNARFQEAGVSPPTTIDEFVSVAEALKEAAGGQPKATLSLASEPDTGPLGVTISEWIVAHGGDPLLLNDEGSVEAFTVLQQLWQDDLLARESLQAKFDTEIDYLQGETAWIATNWPFTSANLAEQGLLEEFSVYEGYSGPARAAHVIGGDVLGVPEGVTGDQREAALELAQFLMSQEVQEIFVEQNAWPPIRGDALGVVPEEQKSTFEAVQAALEDGWFRPNVVYWSDVEAAMNQAIQRIMIRGQDVQTVLDELNQQIADAAEQKGAEYPPTDSA